MYTMYTYPVTYNYMCVHVFDCLIYIVQCVYSAPGLQIQLLLLIKIVYFHINVVK